MLLNHGRSYKMKLLIAAVVVLTVMSAFPPPVLAGSDYNNNGPSITITMNFKDIGATYWAGQYIEEMQAAGIINGYPDGTFKPDKPVNREEFAVLLNKAFDLPVWAGSVQTFRDIPNTRWSYGYVEEAKEYLTGYYPVKGLPYFLPEENAQREDVAVALVKALGLGETKLQNPNILDNTFSDSANISRNLRYYVAVAVENKLISGYPDGTFGPDRGVTRAEATTLLCKAIKNVLGNNYDTGPSLEIEEPNIDENGDLVVTGETEPDAVLTINGHEATVDDDGSFYETYPVDLKNGLKGVLVLVATDPQGRMTRVTKRFKFAPTGPKLLVVAPEISTTPTVEISGTTDPGATVYVNSTKAYVNSQSGAFSQEIKLNEGQNTITISATDNKGRSTVAKKTITLTPQPGPKLVVVVPASTTSSTIEVSGTTDPGAIVYINSSKAYVSSTNGTFTEEVILAEGENNIVITATDSNGKNTTVEKRVTLVVGAPTITVNIPERSSSAYLEVDGFTEPGNAIKVNNKSAYVGTSDGRFLTTVSLSEGINTITIVATNKFGKSTTVTKKVEYGTVPTAPSSPAAPTTPDTPTT